MKRILSLLFFLPLLVAAQDIGNLTEVTDVPEDSWVLIQTNHVVGLRFTRKINLSNLVARLATISTFPSSFTVTGTNLTTTNATTFDIFFNKVGNVFRFRNIVQGTNVIIYRDANSNLVINASAAGGSASITTNGDQFLGVPLAIKSGALLTNPIVRGGMTLNTGDFLMDAPITSVFSIVNASNNFGGWVKFAGMSPGTGKVLTSQDASGNAIWQTPEVTTVLFNVLSNLLRTDITNLQGGTNGLQNSKLANFGGSGTNESFRGVNLPGLTASRATFVDASGNLTNVTSGSPSTEFVRADGTVAVPSGAGDVTTAQLNSASNVLRTDISNLQGATNGLLTRVNNLDGATNGLTTRASNLEGATNGLNSGVNGLITRAITNGETRNVSTSTNLTVGGTNRAGWLRLDNGATNSAAAIIAGDTNVVGHPSVSVNELSQIDGITGNVQTNLDARIASNGGKGTNNGLFGDIQIGNGDGSGTTTISNAFRSRGDLHIHGQGFIQDLGVTANRVMLLSVGRAITTLSTVDSTELGYLDGVTSALQTQLDSKLEAIETMTNGVRVRLTTNINLIAGPSLVLRATNNSANNRTDYWIDAPASALSDGDKGDITVSASGATWTIDNDSVGVDKMQELNGFSIFAKSDTGLGNPTVVTAGTDSVLGRNGSGNLTFAALATGQIANNAVTYAKLQDVSATARVLGRYSGGAGDPEEGTLTQVLDLVGSAAQGDILYRNATDWVRLGAGTSGQVLTTAGVGANPSWAAASGTGSSNTAVQAVGVLDATNTVIFRPGPFLYRTTNSWADGGLSTIVTGVFNSVSAGLTNIYVTNLFDGQPMILKIFASNGVNVAFPQFSAANYSDGAVVPIGTNQWSTVLILRTGTETNIIVWSRTLALTNGNNITTQSNYVTGTITLNVAQQLTNMLAMNFDSLTMLVPTNNALSNITVNLSATNYVEIWTTNNLTFTNWVGCPDYGVGNFTAIIRPQLVNRGVNWGNLGLSNPGYSVAIATNANNAMWTTLTNGQTYALTITRVRTNLFPTITLWQ